MVVSIAVQRGNLYFVERAVIVLGKEVHNHIIIHVYMENMGFIFIKMVSAFAVFYASFQGFIFGFLWGKVDDNGINLLKVFIFHIAP